MTGMRKLDSAMPGTAELAQCSRYQQQLAEAWVATLTLLKLTVSQF